jgi:predicted transcriptional regulator
MSEKKLAHTVKKLVEHEKGTETVVTIRTQKKKVQIFDEPFVMLTQRLALEMAVNGDKATAIVFLYFVGIQAYKNTVGVDVKTMQEKLGYSRSTISRCIKQLSTWNIVKVSQNAIDTRRQDYTMNPHGVWKGDAFEKKKVMRIMESVYDNEQLDMFNLNSEPIKAISPSKDFD